MAKINMRYWLCQILGWGLLGVMLLYFNLFVFKEQFSQHHGEKEYVISLCVLLFCGIACTHILRTILKKINWLKFSSNKILWLCLVAIVVTSVVLHYGADAIERSTPYSFDNFYLKYKLEKAKSTEAAAGLDKTTYYNTATPFKDSLALNTISEIRKNTGWYRNNKGQWKHEDKTNLLSIMQITFLIAIWLLIYIVYHYVDRNRKDQVDKLKLETTVKELELKTIKSHVNPHFIFNSLNSIRALVDENPKRARTAITELSNILRSSLQAQNTETVPLEKELDIVKDYLALEYIRFEERLKVEITIDPNTFQLQVPPMMLQTLVENSIKHGISKLISGGTVKIVASLNHNTLELLVQNSGKLIGHVNGKTTLPLGKGFGIKSTQERLNILYQGKAHFELKNIEGNMVQSKVTMPAITE